MDPRLLLNQSIEPKWETIIREDLVKSATVQQSQNAGLKKYREGQFYSRGTPAQFYINLFNDLKRTIHTFGENFFKLVLEKEKDRKQDEKRFTPEELIRLDSKDLEFSDSDEDFLKKLFQELTELYGDDKAQALADGHTQMPLGLVNGILGSYFRELGIDEVTFYTPSTDDRRVDLFILTQKEELPRLKDLETGKVYLQVVVNRYPIRVVGTNEIIGYIPGPIVINYELTKKNEKWGYELKDIRTKNPQLAAMIRGEIIPPKVLLAAYTQQPKIEALAQQMEKLQEALQTPALELATKLKTFLNENEFDKLKAITKWLFEQRKNLSTKKNISPTDFELLKAVSILKDLATVDGEEQMIALMNSLVNMNKTTLESLIKSPFFPKELGQKLQDFKNLILMKEELSGILNGNELNQSKKLFDFENVFSKHQKALTRFDATISQNIHKTLTANAGAQFFEQPKQPPTSTSTIETKKEKNSRP